MYVCIQQTFFFFTHDILSESQLSFNSQSVLDLSTGCGNGKYLHINKEVFKLGCDVCRPLVDAAWSQGHEVQMCDGLHLPYRDGCFDAVLSIAGSC